MASRPLLTANVGRVARTFLIPDQTEKYRGRKTLVVDLDETLVHSSFNKCDNPDIVVTVYFYLPLGRIRRKNI